MKRMTKYFAAAAASLVSISSLAQEGKPWIHDPSTI